MSVPAFRPQARRAERPPRRGMALIFVLLLLTMLLYLALSFLTRGNFNLFTVSREEQSLEAYSVADAAAHQFAADLVQNLKVSSTTTARAQVLSNIAANDLSASSTPIKDTDGVTTIGYTAVKVYLYGTTSSPAYADVCCYINNPHVYDTSSTFGGSPSAPIIPYDTVRIHAVGSLSTPNTARRVTRTMDETYNVYHLSTTDMQQQFNFAYFMNNWAWWSGGQSGQINMVGNTGANGNYDILDSYAGALGGPTLNMGGKSFTDNLYAELQLRTASSGVSGINGTIQDTTSSQVANYFPRIQTTDLSTIADSNGAFIKMATGQTSRQDATGATVSTPGTLSVQKIAITLDASGNIPRDASGNLQYTTVGSATQVITSGVYPDTSRGQSKENVVLGSQIPTTPGVPNQTVYTDLININGPVVVKGNVVVQGFMTGRGQLFTGRDIYAAGDIQYAKPPSTSPNEGGNGFYTSVKTPTSSDYTNADQVLLACAGSVVEGDVTNKSTWWTTDIQPWLNYKDPTTGANVSGNTAYDYNRDFSFASRVSTSGTFTQQAFSNTYFDTYSPTNGNTLSNSNNNNYSNYVKTINRIDGFLMSNQTVSGIIGSTSQNLTYFGGLISKQDAQVVKITNPSNSSIKSNLYVYQDKRFLNSPDIQMPASLQTGAMVVCVGASQQ
jgi:hypothetical protein